MASPTPSVTTIYTVTGTDANGCQISQLITITVDVPCFNLSIPNVFTPSNGGTLGLDKVFYIDTRNIDGWSVTIFDRWGKTVFTTTDQYKYWDGSANGGGPAPAGVYYYVITGTCQNATYKRDGFLQLIR
jgi:gliding motility-associated-like protein